MVSPIHQNSSMPSSGANMIPAHQSHQQQVQQKTQNCPAPVNRNEQPFASALRILAKQQDGKEDENSQKNSDSKLSNVHNEKEDLSRHVSSSRGISFADSRMNDMRKVSSPQPPEKKVCKLSKLIYSNDNICHLFF